MPDGNTFGSPEAREVCRPRGSSKLILALTFLWFDGLEDSGYEFLERLRRLMGINLFQSLLNPPALGCRKVNPAFQFTYRNNCDAVVEQGVDEVLGFLFYR